MVEVPLHAVYAVECKTPTGFPYAAIFIWRGMEAERTAVARRPKRNYVALVSGMVQAFPSFVAQIKLVNFLTSFFCVESQTPEPAPASTPITPTTLVTVVAVAQKKLVKF